MTVEVFRDFAMRFGRDYGPELLGRVWSEGHRDPDLLARIAPEVWSAHDHPEILGAGGLHWFRWQQIWEHIGFTRDGVRCERPAGRVRLYRGANLEHRRGSSWTDRLESAERFVRLSTYRGWPAQVWTANPPWSKVLAVLEPDDDDGEHELILDTCRVHVALHSTPESQVLDPSEVFYQRHSLGKPM